MQMRDKYAKEKKQHLKKGSAREEQTLALLAMFQAKLHTAAEAASERPKETENVKENEKKKESDEDEDADVDLSGNAWLVLRLQNENLNCLIVAEDLRLKYEVSHFPCVVF
jgi:hypothetical protein